MGHLLSRRERRRPREESHGMYALIQALATCPGRSRARKGAFWAAGWGTALRGGPERGVRRCGRGGASRRDMAAVSIGELAWGGHRVISVSLMRLCAKTPWPNQIRAPGWPRILDDASVILLVGAVLLA